MTAHQPSKRQRAARAVVAATLGKRLPRVSGSLRVEGLRTGITIRRDDHGVPYIEAQNDDDAWFGLGFVHAQDRGGQLETELRAVRGTMAEVAGAEMLGLDRLARRVGFRRAGEAQFALADADVRAQIVAYCAGVNAGFAHGLPKAPHEHALLGCRPTRWEPADVQGFFALLCFALASNWDMELLRLKMLLADGPEALKLLDPRYRPDLPVSYPPGLASGAIDRLADDIVLFEEIFGTGGGSNAWAIAGSRTAHGRPLLANDPHLNPSIPAAWYLVHLRTPQWSSCGATFVGLPAIGSGHNGFAAWGITAAHADNTDLFVEDIGPDGQSVRSGDGWQRCRVLREVIRVKGAEDVVEQIVITPRGPIVSPAFEGSGPALSLSATWLQARPYRGFYGVHRVRSYEAFREQFRQGSTASGSLVYADASGTVGWVLGVEVPRRKAGSGNLPLPGWDRRVGWEPEPQDFDTMPHGMNPSCGYVATANNQPSVEGAPADLGVDWLDGYRQAAICAALGDRSDWDVQSSLQLQLDTRSLPWADARGSVLRVRGTTPDARLALDLLRSWDGHMAGDSAAATVWAFFVSAFCRRLVSLHAPRTAEWALGRGFTALLPYNLMVTRRLSHVVHLLVERPDGVVPGSWDAEIGSLLDGVVGDLKRRYGRHPGGWGWGTVRPLTLEHGFGKKAPLDLLFNEGPFPYAGDASTIAQAAVDLRDPAANPVGVATLRTTIDVGDWERSRFSVIHGQSGNPFSPHYCDQWGAYRSGRGIPIHWSESSIARHTAHRLVVRPR